MSVENPINGYGGYNAIETDKRVLLFSRTDQGFTLFHDYMNLFNVEKITILQAHMYNLRLVYYIWELGVSLDCYGYLGNRLLFFVGFKCNTGVKFVLLCIVF